MVSRSQPYTEAEQIRAIETNLFALFKYWLGSWPGVTLEATPGWIRTQSPSAYRLCNCVMRTAIEPAQLDSHIDAAVEHGRSLNVPLLWWLEANYKPTDLGERLAARGFVHTQSFPGMAIDLKRLKAPADLPPGVHIEEVLDDEALIEWCTACTTGFGNERHYQGFVESIRSAGFGAQAPMRLFLARLQGEAVASAMLFKDAGIAGLYNVATLPATRGRGIGAAVTVAALEAGKSAGCTLGTLYASKLGVNIYRQLGFEEQFQFHNYVWAPPQS